MSLYFKLFWVTLSFTCFWKHIGKTLRSRIHFEKWKMVLGNISSGRWTSRSYFCLPPKRKNSHCHTLFSAKMMISVPKSPLGLLGAPDCLTSFSSGKLETWLSGFLFPVLLEWGECLKLISLHNLFTKKITI